jgi:hypothetical protein
MSSFLGQNGPNILFSNPLSYSHKFHIHAQQTYGMWLRHTIQAMEEGGMKAVGAFIMHSIPSTHNTPAGTQNAWKFTKVRKTDDDLMIKECPLARSGWANTGSPRHLHSTSCSQSTGGGSLSLLAKGRTVGLKSLHQEPSQVSLRSFITKSSKQGSQHHWQFSKAHTDPRIA